MRRAGPTVRLGRGAGPLQQATTAQAQAEPHLDRVAIQQRTGKGGFEKIVFFGGELMGVDHELETPILTVCCGGSERQTRSVLHILASD